jgi:signal transduction histidine kinase
MARRARLRLVAGALVVGLVGYLLVANYRSARALRESLLAHHAWQDHVLSVTLGNALASAQGLLGNLAESREVVAFYESRDLGMSLEYGLAMALVPIRERMRRLVDVDGAAATPLERAALVDAGGKVLVDTGLGPLGATLDPSPAADGVRLSADARHLVAVRSHWFRGRHAGHFVAWLRAERLEELLAREEPAGARLWLLDGAGRAWAPRGVHPALDPALAAVPVHGQPVALRGDGGSPLLAARIPVPGQPFAVLHAAPEAALLGELSPVATAGNLTVAAVVVLLVVIAALSLDTKALLLQTRLDESLRRQEEVAEKHRALEREVAERQRLEEQLRHAQKLEAVGKLAGGVAHDFNNLLAVISGYTGLALEQLPEESPLREDLEEVRRAGARAADLTRQLLAFGRRQVLKPQVLDLNAVVSGTEKMLRRLIGEDVELCTALGEGLPAVRVDPGQLEQVLVNLVVNARDAVPRGGRITVSTAAVELSEAEARLYPEGIPGAFLRLRVADDGAGMDAATLAHLFEPFFTTKERGKGTGLGLSTVYGIVRQSRGFVGVSSARGLGSTFDVFLPVVAERPGARATPVLRGQGAPLGHPGETLLVAEDEPQVRHLLEAQLAAEGFTVLAAGDGAEALRIAEGHPGPIDALVSDVVMPHLSGPQLAEAFRRLHPGSLVVFISGYAEDAVSGGGSLSHASAFLQKPGGVAELPATLRRLLDAPPA